MPITFLGLGSNTGDRERNIGKALDAIQERYEILDFSSLYETEPVGVENQPRFLNMVVCIDSRGSSPEELLRFVKSAEKEIGREKSFRWGPRSIDIDILLIDGVAYESDELSVPHRELLKRNFVLVPLSEMRGRVSVKGEEILIVDRIAANSAEGQRVSLFKRKEELKKGRVTNP
jgi:2-amino-4-hydroxy-6-hydroxymethyldihydropteridine diphosphokinase